MNYKVMEKINACNYFCVFESGDLELATQFLNAYKCKYLDKKFVLFDEVI